MIPHIINYTDDMPTWMGGYAKWFYIAIRPKYRNDRVAGGPPGTWVF
jgi:hypothetical protein